MKKTLITIVLAINSVFAFCQTANPTIQAIINQVNLDSLSKYVNELSGEIPVVVNGDSVTIQHRISWTGNDLAADYLVEKLESLGYTANDQAFGSDGRNIYAIHEGTQFPDEKYIICAHYDAVDYYCADDNASGSACVIEAARILSQYDFPYTLIFALWDEEEVGLYGSAHFAENAAANSEIIKGVINLDMIAWDSNNDGLMEIHSSNTANSPQIATSTHDVNSLYGLNLDPTTFTPGTSASDHSSFWDNGYGAVLFIEGYYSGDFNPYYHSEDDRISIFNLPYFHNVSKLAIATIATMAYGEYVPAPAATFVPQDGAVDVPVEQQITVSFNTPIRNIDDSEIVNPEELFVFKDISGFDVEFSATISSNKDEITIIPDSNLNYLQQYTLEVSNQIENNSDVQYQGDTIHFTTVDNIGVLNQSNTKFSVFPNPANHWIFIQLNEAFDSEITVEIYNHSGMLLYKAGHTNFGRTITIDISDLSSGVYLVRLNNKDFVHSQRITVL